MNNANAGFKWWEPKMDFPPPRKESLTLDNHNAPPAHKADPKAFRPMNDSERLRQQIYKLLQSAPGLEYTMQDISDGNGIAVSKVTRAAKALVKGGFATTVEHEIPRPTKKDLGKVQKIKAIKYVVPWQGRANKKW